MTLIELVSLSIVKNKMNFLIKERTDMPITTFLTESDCNRFTSNHELNELLARVQKETGENWQVIEQNFTEVIGFWPFLRCKKRKLYNLYVELKRPEFQIINFYCDDNNTVNESVEVGYVISYLFGILVGLHKNYLEKTK